MEFFQHYFPQQHCHLFKMSHGSLIHKHSGGSTNTCQAAQAREGSCSVYSAACAIPSHSSWEFQPFPSPCRNGAGEEEFCTSSPGASVMAQLSSTRGVWGSRISQEPAPIHAQHWGKAGSSSWEVVMEILMELRRAALQTLNCREMGMLKLDKL